MRRALDSPVQGWLAWAAAALALCGCARLVPPEVDRREDPLDQTTIARFESADPNTRSVVNLPASAHSAKWWFQAGVAKPQSLTPYARLDSLLDTRLTSLPDSTRVRVMVTFTDTVTMPVFPRLREDLPRNAPLNLALLDTADDVIKEIVKRRSARYAVDTVALKTAFGARILDHFWVTQTCWIQLRADSARSLLNLSQIEYISPDTGRVAPDHDANRANDVDAVRARLNADPYLALAVHDGRMALIDTGVRSEHQLLCDPSHLCMVADCVSGLGTTLSATQCSPTVSPLCSYAGGGDTYPDGHGTKSAAILTGNGKDTKPGTGNGGWFKGITRATLDCFQTYGADGRVVVPAVLRAVQLAMARLDPILVFEMQANQEPDIGHVTKAADNAFGCGFVVIAANGNEKANGVGVPAGARRAIGVGAWQMTFDMPVSDEARGPTADGRGKPDLLAPSYVETAANGSNSDMAEHTGTSGATACAAGAACLLRNWMTATSSWPDPGKVYALLLLSGSHDGPFVPDDPEGVGLIQLIRTGGARYGKTWVSSGTNHVTIHIPIPATGAHRLSAAIWWPEKAKAKNGVAIDTHNDLDLEIVSPGSSGSVKAKSDGKLGVFERTYVDGNPRIGGTWKIRIRPKTMHTPSQVVYWATAVTP